MEKIVVELDKNQIEKLRIVWKEEELGSDEDSDYEIISAVIEAFIQASDD